MAPTTTVALTKALLMLFSLLALTVHADIQRGSVFGFGGSDPHVTCWDGDRFEFHQQGDFTLVQRPDLDIHIRTKVVDGWWSHVESAVLRLGEETIEVQGGTEQSRYWINGEEGYAAMKPNEYMRVWLKQGQEVMIRQVNSKQFQIRVDFGNDEGVMFETFQQFIRVDVQANDDTDDSGSLFSNGIGLLGSYPEGVKLGRDKTTIMKNTDKFAKEWQVLPSSSEASLFRS